MSTLDKTVQEFLQVFEEARKKGTSPYDTQAEVKRVENGIAWVHIAGGVDETPVKLTINAKAGDVVQVRVSGGQAFLIGNVTAPPTDDSTALQAIEASRAAKQAAVQAEKDAETAANAATQAQSDAQAAHSAATEAIETAESVHDIAVQAQEDAEAATTAAGQATQAANSASNLATQAQSAAQAANTAAGQAQSEAQAASAAAGQAQTAATQVQNNLKSVVQGASTVEKAVSVMQTALEAIVDYDPTEDEVQEYFWHDANGAHILGDESGYRNDLNSTGMSIVDTATEDSVAEFGADGIQLGSERTIIISAQGGGVADKTIWVEVLSETRTLPAQIDLSEYEAFMGMDGAKDRIYCDGQLVGTALPGLGAYFYKGTAKTISNTQAGISIEYSGADLLVVKSLYGTNTAEISVRFRIKKKGGIFSFGQRFGDAGAFSAVFGESLIASGDNQLVLGKYNEEDSQKAFIIGNGSSNTAGTNIIRSNSFTIDWDGNIDIASGAKYKINGNNLSASDVGAVPTTRKINGKALNQDVDLTIEDFDTVKTITVNVTSTTGQFVSAVCKRYGQIVQLTVGIRNTAAVASGGDFYVGTFNNALPAPLMLTTSGSFLGKTPVTAALNTAKKLTVRNSSPSSVTVGSSNTIYVSFTYITAD